MSRYIRYEDAVEQVAMQLPFSIGTQTYRLTAERMLGCCESIEIVRCKECKWYNCKACFRDDGMHNHREHDDYCSYGERIK